MTEAVTQYQCLGKVRFSFTNPLWNLDTLLPAQNKQTAMREDKLTVASFCFFLRSHLLQHIINVSSCLNSGLEQISQFSLCDVTQEVLCLSNDFSESFWMRSESPCSVLPLTVPQQVQSPQLTLLTFASYLNVCNVYHQHPTMPLGSAAFSVLFQVLPTEKSQQNDASFTVQMSTI